MGDYPAQDEAHVADDVLELYALNRPSGDELAAADPPETPGYPPRPFWRPACETRCSSPKLSVFVYAGFGGMKTMAAAVRGFWLLFGSVVLMAQQPVFSNVGLLQRATVPVLPAVGWKDLGSGLGYYGSSQIDLPASGFVPSTVKYSISGKASNRVDEALISAFVASPQDLPPAKVKVEVAVAQWFRSVGKPVPAGLSAAIKSGKPFQALAGGFSVRYVVERGTGNPIKLPDGSSYRCTTMDMTIKPL